MNPIENIIPQRGNMLLIDRLIDASDETTIAQYAPKSNQWYSDEAGQMPAWIGLELMAQTVAAHVGETKRRAGIPPKHGVLAGTRRYRASVASFSVGRPLTIKVTLVYQDESGLGAYECSILDEDTSLATATLKVFEPNEFETFLQESK